MSAATINKTKTNNQHSGGPENMATATGAVGLGPLKPMPLWMSLLLFGIPAAIAFLLFYFLCPFLDRAGMPLFANFLVGSIPFVLLFAAALAAYRLEGHSWSWAALTERFRLRPMNGETGLWTAGLAVFFCCQLHHRSRFTIYKMGGRTVSFT